MVASYENPVHEGRLIIVPCLRDAFAELHVTEQPKSAVAITLAGVMPPVPLYQVKEYGAQGDEGDIYHFPM